jgi:TRAP-type C4-dicarboxylate transport system substrate-binding protein
MPMGEVYSALAKGVIDGVVAPADTIKSLHFSEVAHHFTAIRFSRGAYPARAMSDRAWRRLPPDLQALLAASKPVWEQFLNREILAAEKAGVEFGRSHGIDFQPLPEAEQARFDQLYNSFARQQAKQLSAFGLSGEPVLDAAQQIIGRGTIRCETGSGVTK